MEFHEKVKNYESLLHEKKSSIANLSIKEKCREIINHPCKIIKNSYQKLKLNIIINDFSYFKKRAYYYSAMASYLSPDPSYIGSKSVQKKHDRWMKKSTRSANKLVKIMKKHPL